MTDRSDDLIPRRDPTPSAEEQIRARQSGRAKVMAWLLAGFVILVFAISIVRIQAGMG